MIQGIAVWAFTLLLAVLLVNIIWPSSVRKDKIWGYVLFLYHSLLAVAYYLYALFNPSDSKGYYKKILVDYRGAEWSDFYGTSTTFIEFIGYPFIKYLGFTYESMMVVFSFFGFVGFLFFFLFFKERTMGRVHFLGFNLLILIFFLPNLHFWSSSFGKGALIFGGFGLFFYALNNPLRRVGALLIGGYFIYMVRPHILFVLLIAIVLGYVFSTKSVGVLTRVVILCVAAGILFYIFDDIVALTGLDDESIFDDTLSVRANRLSRATSGIDLSNYSLPEKILTFWFRPLFFDAPGILGFIISFENFFYVLVFLNLLRPKALSFILKSDAITKTCLLSFLGVSVALAQISGNLGLAMRQKSQVMILMMFVILKFLDHENQIRLKLWQWRKRLDKRNKRRGTDVMKV